MRFPMPTPEELRGCAAELGLELEAQRAELLHGFLGGFAAGYGLLAELDDALPPPPAPRLARRPEPEENPLGAWAVLTEIRGAAEGPLAGRTVAVKDNIFVAGVPLANGTALLEGFTPEFDATVVTRLLEAGAVIRGKSVCEFLCASGGSVTASSGVVHNPHRRGYSTGGSSSGSAALVGAGHVELALGCDQGGSIRMPSSLCGVCGMKPTHGLVPYTGILGMEASLDHVGPITADVADNAALLEVLAGPDGYDARQRQVRVEPYAEALGRPVQGLRVAVLREGFDTPLSDPLVDACVREAIQGLRKLGMHCEEVSVPQHAEGLAVWAAILVEGFANTLRLNGAEPNLNGPWSPALADAMEGLHHGLGEMPINVQLLLLLARWLERMRGRFYARAKNRVPALCRAYDRVLARHDLLLMPTTPGRAVENPPSLAEASPEFLMAEASQRVLNTCQFDVTGHPALSLPCGLREGLPVGMMLVGRPFDEATLYRVAHAFEQAGDWRER